MKVKAPGNVASTAFEYFLYAIILVETATAAFAYKTVSKTGQLWPGTIGYLEVLYFGVLAWVFFELNRIHRKRKQARETAGDIQAEPVAPPTMMAQELIQPAIEPQTPRIAAGDSQASGTSTLRNSNSELDTRDAIVTATTPTAIFFGLTRIQLMIVVLVFFAGLRFFTWALARFMK